MSRGLVEPTYPEWATWAQRAVYRHRAFQGRVLVPLDRDACWLWTAGRVAKGYGRVRFDRRTWWAHRLARLVAFGDLPEAVCHTCDNPPCVNPEHLRSGTLADNTAEMWAKGRSRVTVSITPDRLPLVMRALASVGPPRSRGRRSRIEAIAVQGGTSVRTIYRLLDPESTPHCYRRTNAREGVAA
jgi:hypothetical protein